MEINVRIRQRRSQWFGQVRRGQEQGAGVLKMVKGMEVSRRRPVGRPKKNVEDCAGELKSVGEEMAVA